jgi:DNA-binding GntR family transcriptional regulator
LTAALARKEKGRDVAEANASPLDTGDRNPTSSQGGSLVDDAYASIRRGIIECRLAPGERVTEGQLAEELGIGKTPVREALLRLTQAGLVHPIRRSGYRIAPITLRDVRDLFGLRLIIEPAAAELAVGRVDLDELREIQARYDACYLADPAAACLLNSAFHLVSARASGNARLERTLAQLLSDSERMYIAGFRFRGRPYHGDQWHDRLIDAFASGDPRLVRECAAAQVVHAERLVTDALLHSPALLDAGIMFSAGKDNSPTHPDSSTAC